MKGEGLHERRDRSRTGEGRRDPWLRGGGKGEGPVSTGEKRQE